MKKIAYVALGVGLVLCLARQENSPSKMYSPNTKANASIASIEKDKLGPGNKGLEAMLRKDVSWRFYEKSFQNTPEDVRSKGNVYGAGEASLAEFLEKSTGLEDYKGMDYYNELMNENFTYIEKAMETGSLERVGEYYMNDFLLRRRIYDLKPEPMPGISLVKDDMWSKIKDLKNPPVNTILEFRISQGEEHYAIKLIKGEDGTAAFEKIILPGKLSIGRNHFINIIKGNSYEWGLLLDQQRVRKGYNPHVRMKFQNDNFPVTTAERLTGLYTLGLDKSSSDDIEKEKQ